MDKLQRNFIEYALIMKMTKISICQQDELESEVLKKEFDEDFPNNIYFIISRPKVTLVPSKCEFKDHVAKFVFKIHEKETVSEESLIIKSADNTNDFELKSDYPYTKFYIHENGKEVFSAKSSLFYFMNQKKYSEKMDSEILYIGQSYGKNGKRKPPERLKSHSTLQKIYYEALQNNPDKEIWLNLLSFERLLFTSFDGADKSVKREENEVEKATNIMYKFNQNELNEKQIVNFTEASLIKYFKPKYNVVYKDVFPDPNHKTYTECYDLDVNSVAFELNTETIGTKLFTENIKPSYMHLGSFTLESREKRKSLFGILDNDLPFNNYANIKIE